MSAPVSKLETRLRWAGALIVAGLGVEVVTLGFVHPIALLTFAGPGVGLVGVGVILYLLTLVRFG